MGGVLNYLSDKKVLVLGAILLLTLAGVGVFAVFADTDTKKQNPLSESLRGLSVNSGITARSVQDTIATTDSDDDGLLDWEEGLWGTDPDNPDTDGDGTTDGKEVDTGRHPKKPGPDDAFVLSEISGDASNGALVTDESLNLTERFARELFEEYLITRQSGGSIGQLNQAFLTGTLLNQAGVQNSITAPQRFTASDITNRSSVSSNAKLAYGTALGQVIINNSFESKNEVFLLKEILDADDESRIAELDKIVNGYQGILNGLLSIEVPEDALEEHLAFVNSVSSLLTAQRGLRGVFDDPITALIHLGTYETLVLNLSANLSGLQRYFTKQGVVFESGSAGESFMELGI